MFIVNLITLSCFDANEPNPLESVPDDVLAGQLVPQIIQPAGLEQWFPGTSQDILWTPATGADDSVVTIQLIHDDLLTMMVAEQAPDTGVYTWTVPDTPSPFCRIRISGQGGFSESAATFTIKLLPVLKQLPIAGPGRTPAANQSVVVFTSNRNGNNDLWQLDRTTGALQSLTTDTGSDDHASILKPDGHLIAFTSNRDGQNNIWGMTTGGTNAYVPFQITTAGGERPAWQNIQNAERPSLAYKALSSTQASDIIGATLDTPMDLLPEIQLPISFQRSPQPMTTNNTGPVVLIDIGRPAWGVRDETQTDVLVYNSGEIISQMWQVGFTTESNMFQPIATTLVDVIPELFIQHPSVSPNGDHIAFSADGNIWMVSSHGGTAIKVTFGDTTDDFPDWASDTEIVFQRSLSPSHP